MGIRRELDQLGMSLGQVSLRAFGDRVYLDKPLVDRIMKLEHDIADLELTQSLLSDKIRAMCSKGT